MNYNKMLLAGNITRELEVTYTPAGHPVLDFSVASNRRWKDAAGEKQEEVTFFNVRFWGKAAEVIAQYCGKGSPIFIDGYFKEEKWTDKQTQQPRSKMILVGENFQFLPRSSSNSNGSRPPARDEYSDDPAPPPPRPRATHQFGPQSNAPRSQTQQREFDDGPITDGIGDDDIPPF